MKLIEFVKLIIKHKVALTAIPLLTGLLAILLTKNPNYNYYSQTVLYTGLASGSSIEMDKAFNYFATNIAFDNLINIINSRETQEEVSIRLLSQHLLLEAPNDKYISAKAYEEFKEVIPDELYQYVERSGNNGKSILNGSEDINQDKNAVEINKADYEQTVANLMALMNRDNTNFLYSLLNFEHPYYSLEAISKVKAERVSTSDLVKLSFEVDDPGICQQTLAIFNEVCIKKYKDLKENGSDAVVQYFESQLDKAEKNLKDIEARLLKFNQDYNIINYYEQSKAVAIVKEDMDMDYKIKTAELAGSEASLLKLEEKLEIQELVQKKSNQILENKKSLGDINYEIAMTEAKSADTEESARYIETLKKKSLALNKEIKSSVEELYSFQNSVDGVPITKVLPEWVDKVVQSEDLKAKLEVMDKQNKDFQQQYAVYAPAGANLKRIEREIEVAEQEYLEILHGLNQAKLKFQDTQLSANLKAIDPPYFPLNPIPSKRKIIIVAIVLLSAILLLGAILFMEFFDNTLKNLSVASSKLSIPAMGMIPKIFKSNSPVDLKRVQDRLMELIMLNLNHFLISQKPIKAVKTITILSTKEEEGKTVVAANIARKLKEAGKSVLLLNHSQGQKQRVKSGKFPLIHLLLGYNDPRNDYSQPFLANETDYLDKSEYQTYKLDASFYNAKEYGDLNINTVDPINKQPEYVIIELPNILETNYPADLILASDLTLLVCRSNRLWSKADENLLDNIKELTGSKLQFIINGVEITEVEALLGELPKKRSKIRRKIKNILRFQFYSKSHI
jgi:capsular polysaccharide biosynthesis protein